MRTVRSILPTVCCCAGLLALLLLSTTFVVAKEIEATREWTLLGENDTIAAGMHVRMDMTTGERWVKLPDEDDDVNTATETSMVITEDGSTTQEEGDGRNSADPQYDYEMMYRALSRLPDEEKKRIQFDDATIATDHEKLRELWTKRQEELKELDVLDLPQVLKDAIQHLRDFLKQPMTTLAADKESGKESIVEILLDLEFHLQDIDMTRDFHTLGGWPVLGSLLSDQILQDAVAADPSNNTSIDINAMVDALHNIQAKAAWALGTAVKNTEEFHPYVLERSIGERGSQTSVLDLVVSQLAQESCPVNKKIKLVYCLGSFLRGNPDALEYFRTVVSSKFIPGLMKDSLTSSSPKLYNKLLLLVTDLHQQAAADAEASADVCEVVTRQESFDAAAPETILDAISTLAGSCRASWDTTALRGLLERMLVEAAKATDAGVKAERIENIQSTVRLLDETKIS